jgi:hypothetical protein
MKPVNIERNGINENYYERYPSFISKTTITRSKDKQRPSEQEKGIKEPIRKKKSCNGAEAINKKSCNGAPIHHDQEYEEEDD